MQYVKRCVKFDLPNGCTLDLLSNVICELERWIQVDKSASEACGFLLGYRNKSTGNLTITYATPAQKADYRSRFSCKIVDHRHYAILEEQKRRQNYYMGVWHTHPQMNPLPSIIDTKEWRSILKYDRTGSKYALFVIAGLEEFRIWVGDYKNNRISEIEECSYEDGLYRKKC